ncbi:MAG: hypothetical protein AB1938_14780 [Myxococcota bacterium]
MSAEIEDAVQRARESLAATKRELEALREQLGIRQLEEEVAASRARAEAAERELAVVQDRIRLLQAREAAAWAILKG